MHGLHSVDAFVRYSHCPFSLKRTCLTVLEAVRRRFRRGVHLHGLHPVSDLIVSRLIRTASISMTNISKLPIDLISQSLEAAYGWKPICMRAHSVDALQNLERRPFFPALILTKANLPTRSGSSAKRFSTQMGSILQTRRYRISK